MEKQTKTKSSLQILMVLTFAVFFKMSLKAQEPSYSYFDSLTYQLYTDERWEALVDAGMNAISQGHDGYYMQIRTGIALFNRGRYRSAERYLTKAWELSPNEVSGEYLYLSKLWGGHYLESEVIREKLPKSVQERLGLSTMSVIKSADVSWAGFSPNKKDPIREIGSNSEDAGSRLSANSFSHYSGSVSHRLGRHGILNHQAGILKKKSDLFIASSEFNNALRTDDYQTDQFNYYLRWDRSLGRNWSLKLFGHGLWFNFPVYSMDDASGSNNNVRWQQATYKDFDFVAGVTLVKSFDLADLSLEVAGSSVGNQNQFQGTGSILLYPFYNLNFYLEGRLAFNQSTSEQHLLGGGTIGGRLSRFLWLEATGMLSDEARFFHSQQGNLVFNGPELVNYMAGINAIVLPMMRLKWYLSWQQRGYTSYFIPSDAIAQPQQPLNKNYQLISTSLLWTF